MTSRAYPALAVLERLPSLVPQVWSRYESVRQLASEHQPWPAWCYGPIALAYALCGPDEHSLAFKITALAAWRMTKVILRFDATLKDALMQTALSGAVPVDVIRRLPGWCVYVELDGMDTFRGPAHGAWCWLEPASYTDPRPVHLMMLLNTEGDMSRLADADAMILLSARLEGDSLLESVRAAVGAAVDPEVVQALTALVEPVLSMLLYVCSDNAELERDGKAGRPTIQTPVATRRSGSRLFPAAGPAVWDVGLRIGAALRRTQEEAGTREAAATGEGRTPHAHVRAPHWHTFVSGSRRLPLEIRPREVRWMPPILVGTSTVEDLPAVVRQVR
jgi:hypothetical protein